MIPIKRDFELSGLPITKVSLYLSNKHNYSFENMSVIFQTNLFRICLVHTSHSFD